MKGRAASRNTIPDEAPARPDARNGIDDFLDKTGEGIARKWKEAASAAELAARAQEPVAVRGAAIRAALESWRWLSEVYGDYRRVGMVMDADNKSGETIHKTASAAHEELRGLIAKAEELEEFLYRLTAGKNESPGYTDEAPPSKAAVTPPLRMPDDFNIAVKEAKAENLARAKPRPKPRSSTLQFATYRALVRNVDLLNPTLPEAERLTRARRLVQAYNRLRDRRPTFHDDNPQLVSARSIVNRANYQSRKQAASKMAM